MNRPNLIQIQPKPQPMGMIRFVKLIPNNYVETAQSNKSVIFLVLALSALAVIYLIKKRCQRKMDKLDKLPDFNKIKEVKAEEPTVLPEPQSTRNVNQEQPEESHEEINVQLNDRNIQMPTNNNQQQLPDDLRPHETNPTFPKDTCSLNKQENGELDAPTDGLFGNDPTPYEGWGEFSNF